jgi:hypothetical protein
MYEGEYCILKEESVRERRGSYSGFCCRLYPFICWIIIKEGPDNFSGGRSPQWVNHVNLCLSCIVCLPCFLFLHLFYFIAPQSYFSNNFIVPRSCFSNTWHPTYVRQVPWKLKLGLFLQNCAPVVRKTGPRNNKIKQMQKRKHRRHTIQERHRFTWFTQCGLRPPEKLPGPSFIIIQQMKGYNLHQNPM